MPRKQQPASVTEKNTFAVNLREIMKRRGETQATLADRIRDGYKKKLYPTSITRQAISLYALGQSTPKTDVLTTLCKALDVSADYLLGIQKSENPLRDLHPLINDNNDFFDFLLSSEQVGVEFLKSIDDYIKFDINTKVFALGNKGDLHVYGSYDEVDFANEQLENGKSDFYEYISAEEMHRQLQLRFIEKDLEQLRKMYHSKD